jgi:hypothetical protein
VKRCARQHLPAAAADPLRIRIASGLHDNRPRVQKLVIRPILTNHEIAICVVSPVPVDVMYFGAVGQIATERSLGDQRMDADASRRNA